MTTNMKKEFIPYEEALQLKELGFDEPCFGYFVPLLDNSIEFELKLIETHGKKIILAPLWQQVFKWFRNKYGLTFSIIDNSSHGFFIYLDKNLPKVYDTYEKAELAVLRKLIKIVNK